MFNGDFFASLIERTGSITIKEYLICLLVALVLGIVISLAHMFKNEHSKSMAITLVVLPAIVQAIILLVNGSIGTGLSVLGAFSLVRFRSGTGNAREITSVFLATAVGLATAMGYISIAVILVVVICGVILVLSASSFGGKRGVDRSLKIIIPEDLDFEGIFDDIFEKYTTKTELVKCKTTNMGSLYELSYDIKMKPDAKVKSFIDEIRCRNGNLTVICGRPVVGKEEL
ncbi:MAG: DUF4956 domain-containing protein [Lachnospiraceae bacterium]|nr:DUF4956 domain-containing protein [Lachnospiraceae bacterium]